MASFDIPKLQKAAVRVGTGESARAPVKEIDVPTPGPNDLLIKLEWTGVCASDNALIHDNWMYNNVGMFPSSHGIGGHEGAGTVISVPPSMSHKWKVGDRAGIKWCAAVCGNCEFCTSDGIDELLCPNQRTSAVNFPGTFQQYALSDGDYTTRIPEGVELEEAGPIMCGGVTAYVGCKRSGVRPGQWIVIVGAGGGLGHFGLQYAVAMGMRVIAIDTGASKSHLCKSLGAEHFIDFNTTPDVAAEVKKITTYGAHANMIISWATAPFEQATTLVRPGGTIVIVGLPHDGNVIAGARPLTYCLNRLSFVGSVTGTLRDVDEALDFCARGLIHPVLTKGKLEDLDHYCDLLEKGEVTGRVVMKLH